MTRVLSHRGPDGEGTVMLPLPGSASANGSSPSGAGAGLGHRRLSIIDLEGGAQPLSNEDETVWIVFNGEIYNYRELRPHLETRGHRFRTASDTECIVHLYEEYGPAGVDYLRGMFAFAIYDVREERLFFARDRLGQKPFFYRPDGDRFWFGSELKSLLQAPNAPRELDRRALDDYFTYQYVPHPQCILRGYHKLPPAHWGIFDRNGLRLQRYWKAPYRRDDPVSRAGEVGRLVHGAAHLSYESQCRLLRETLTEAVRLRMRSDVPLGAFLSGGIDSTIISGLMQSLSEQPVHTFSIGFPEASFDERSYAREAARHLGTTHHEQVVEPQALQILPRLIWHYDEPFSDSSAIPTMYLSEMTRHYVTVALSGDGGDELFAGYDRYRAVRIGGWFDRVPQPFRAMATSPLWQKLPASVEQRSFRRRLKRLLHALGQPPDRRYLRWISIFDDEARRSLYTQEFLASLRDYDSAEFILEAFRTCSERDGVTQASCVDVFTYLPCDILTKVDVASMAFGLEARSPFLDHHVTELAARLPIDAKLRGRRAKRILIDTFSDLLPESIQRRSKMGFGVPLVHWFRNELRELMQDTLLDRTSLSRGIFRPDAVRQLVREHLDGTHDHSYRLWSLLCFEMWQRTFIDPAEPPSASPAILSAVG